MTKQFKNAVIASFLAGRSVSSIAAEYGKSERSIRRIVLGCPTARAELLRAVL